MSKGTQIKVKARQAWTTLCPSGHGLKMMRPLIRQPLIGTQPGTGHPIDVH